jgi:hypothetical protein
MIRFLAAALALMTILSGQCTTIYQDGWIASTRTARRIRGLNHDRATSFPAQLRVASAWDRDLVERIGAITGLEARALGYTNVYSPILDLSRDPRWGRVVETYSEDPYLVSELGRIQVRAIQAQRVVSTPKHFAIYSIPKGGRDGSVRRSSSPQPVLPVIHVARFVRSKGVPAGTSADLSCDLRKPENCVQPYLEICVVKRCT